MFGDFLPTIVQWFIGAHRKPVPRKVFIASGSDAAGSAENELVEKSLGEDFWKPSRWTCAHRYALFTLAGIAAEDDLDAPDPGSNPRADPNSPYVNGRGRRRIRHRHQG
jgi:hypothetical protein